jgi:hypothetical protein
VASRRSKRAFCSLRKRRSSWRVWSSVSGFIALLYRITINISRVYLPQRTGAFVLEYLILLDNSFTSSAKTEPTCKTAPPEFLCPIPLVYLGPATAPLPYAPSAQAGSPQTQIRSGGRDIAGMEKGTCVRKLMMYPTTALIQRTPTRTPAMIRVITRTASSGHRGCHCAGPSTTGKRSEADIPTPRGRLNTPRRRPLPVLTASVRRPSAPSADGRLHGKHPRIQQVPGSRTFYPAEDCTGAHGVLASSRRLPRHLAVDNNPVR